MTDAEIISEQVEFFAKNLSGCGFAAHAARDPEKFEWFHQLIRPEQYANMDEIIARAIDTARLSTLSLVFPDVRTEPDLDALLTVLDGNRLYLFEKHDTENNRCYRYRLKIAEEDSLVSGFGPFESMPVTRRTPHTSVVMRVKPRPNYEVNMKEPEPGITHVADMRIKGLSKRNWARMWNNSFLRTRGLLKHKPDEESAARTTFVIPLDRAGNISL